MTQTDGKTQKKESKRRINVIIPRINRKIKLMVFLGLCGPAVFDMRRLSEGCDALRKA